VIKNRGTVRNADAICEQPSGKRLLALANTFPIHSNDDEVVGAVKYFPPQHEQDRSWPKTQSSQRSLEI
jgi:hypothetical protein